MPLNSADAAASGASKLCMYWDEASGNWSSSGLQLSASSRLALDRVATGGNGSAVNGEGLEWVGCETTHLTSFVLYSIQKAIVASVTNSSYARKSENDRPMALKLLGGSLGAFFIMLAAGVYLDSKMGAQLRVAQDNQLSNVVPSVSHKRDSEEQSPLWKTWSLPPTIKEVFVERALSTIIVLRVHPKAPTCIARVISVGLCFFQVMVSMVFCGVIGSSTLQEADSTSLSAGDAFVGIFCGLFGFLLGHVLHTIVWMKSQKLFPTESVWPSRVLSIIPVGFFGIFVWFCVVHTYSFSTEGNSLWVGRLFLSLVFGFLLVPCLFTYWVTCTLMSRGAAPFDRELKQRWNYFFQASAMLVTAHPAHLGPLTNLKSLSKGAKYLPDAAFGKTEAAGKAPFSSRSLEGRNDALDASKSRREKERGKEREREKEREKGRRGESKENDREKETKDRHKEREQFSSSRGSNSPRARSEISKESPSTFKSIQPQPEDEESTVVLERLSNDTSSTLSASSKVSSKISKSKSSSSAAAVAASSLSSLRSSTSRSESSRSSDVGSNVSDSSPRNKQKCLNKPN
eukprot:GILI01028008.1.p1 GENE.GILI01028008.1~~GILI01028008.1.p1  ORF type:complete len:572 (+),score=92.40 GILI01028008.1:905-2620(+)